MSADLLQFLKNKFMDELDEAEEEHLPPHDIPLHPYFQQIRQVLQTTSITPSTPITMKHCLYDLSIALTDCIIFLEKRKMKINKDSSQGQGQGQGQDHYSLPELWFLWKTKRKLIRIKKKLDAATSHPVVIEQTSLPAVTDVPTTSSSSSSSSFGSLSYHGPSTGNLPYELRSCFIALAKKIANLFLGTSELDEGGFSKEIGIVGIGGCGKTIAARMVFENSDADKVFDSTIFDFENSDVDSRIWINLQAILKGEIDFMKILQAMLEQCGDRQIDWVDGSVEEQLLDALHKALQNKSYLLVFDGVWDINLDWYSRLKERLEWRNKSNQNRTIMITTRLDGVAKRMVGPNNLYRMQPLSKEDIWHTICAKSFEGRFSYLPQRHPITVKMKDEMIYQSHGLLLAATTFSTIMMNQTYGSGLGSRDYMELMYGLGNPTYYVMMNPKDDANQGNDLLLSLRSMLAPEVSDISEEDPQSALDHFLMYVPTERRQRVRILVFGGDATTNRVLQALSDMKEQGTPSVGVMPLGTQVHISISLGWGNQLSDTDSKPHFFMRKLRDAEEILIDSWNFAMRTSIPDCLEILDTLHVQHVSEEDLLHMGGDKYLRGKFWNYLIIGLDAEEWFGASHFKSWPRNIALPISVKIKDHQHQWKKLNLPHSIRSIVCLNMPSFPGGLDPWSQPNLRKKRERNFTPSFVDDELLEIIGFRDSWHGENFLPLNVHGTRLAQTRYIRFELCKGLTKHIYMSFDGTRWKQPTPIDDDNYLIEVSYSSATKMLSTSTSKCKRKACSPNLIESSQ